MKRSDKKRAREAAKAGAIPIEPVLPQAMFTTGFDQIALDWHKNPSAPDSLLPSIRARMVLEGVRVSEALLVSPKVAFRVYGENDVICRLLDTYAISGVEALLEEGAIEFVLWPSGVVHFEKEHDGLMPLMPLTLTSPAHCDPHVSNELGLKRWPKASWSELQRLSKLATERTRILDPGLSQRAIDAVYAAYRNGGLATTGFDAAVPLERLSAAEAARLSGLAGRVHEGMALLDADYDLHECAMTWEALIAVCARVARDDRIVTTTQKVLRLEGLPSLLKMFEAGAVTFADIVTLRKHPATTEFRNWLWSQPNPRDAEAVSNAYAREISQQKLVDKTWFKVAKIMTLNVGQAAAGVGIGAVNAGLAGAIAGGVLGAGVSVADTFLLEKLLRGPSPRRFAEEVFRRRNFERVEPLEGEASPSGNRALRRQRAAKQRLKK